MTIFENCEHAMDGSFEAIQHITAQPWPTDYPMVVKDAEEKEIQFDDTM
ncbi:MAG: hypothetical protein ACUVTL_08970 [Thermoproteota archaeon]